MSIRTHNNCPQESIEHAFINRAAPMLSSSSFAHYPHHTIGIIVHKENNFMDYLKRKQTNQHHNNGPSLSLSPFLTRSQRRWQLLSDRCRLFFCSPTTCHRNSFFLLNKQQTLFYAQQKFYFIFIFAKKQMRTMTMKKLN